MRAGAGGEGARHAGREEGKERSEGSELTDVFIIHHFNALILMLMPTAVEDLVFICL